MNTDKTPLLKACKVGNEADVVRLIPLTEPIYYDDALFISSMNGHLKCVQHLISVSCFSERNEALTVAANNGHLDIVKLLIPISDPKYNGSLALRLAAHNGHLECVTLLIPVSEPKDGCSEAVWYAFEKEHSKCFEILLPVSDIGALLYRLRARCWPSMPNRYRNLEQQIYQQQNQRLNDAIGNAGCSSGSRKI